MHLIPTLALLLSSAQPFAGAALETKPPIEPAAPFGLRQGTPASQIELLKREGEHVYQIRVPAPSAEFTTYVATVTPEHGLCKIEASGPLLVDDSFGTRVAGRFQALRAAVAGIYGRNRVFDFVQQGSSHKRAGDWAEAVRRGERSLAAFWDAEERSDLPTDLSAVRLEARAADWRTTYLSLIVEYANVSPCLQSLKTKPGGIARP